MPSEIELVVYLLYVLVCKVPMVCALVTIWPVCSRIRRAASLLRLVTFSLLHEITHDEYHWKVRAIFAITLSWVVFLLFFHSWLSTSPISFLATVYAWVLIWHNHTLWATVRLIRMTSWRICLHTFYFRNRLQSNSRRPRVCVKFCFGVIVETVLLFKVVGLHALHLLIEHTFILRKGYCSFWVLSRELVLTWRNQFCLLTLIKGEKVCFCVKSSIRNRLIAFVCRIKRSNFFVYLWFWFVIWRSNACPSMRNVSLIASSILLNVFEFRVV